MSSDSAGPTPFIFQTIDSIGEKELDSLPYGVIQLDAQGTVLRYNAYEEGLSGLTRQKVVGKNFFKQIEQKPVTSCSQPECLCNARSDECWIANRCKRNNMNTIWEFV